MKTIKIYVLPTVKHYLFTLSLFFHDALV